MDSVRTSPEQLASGTISSHSLKNIAKEVVPLLAIPKIDIPDDGQVLKLTNIAVISCFNAQVSPTNQSVEPIPR